MSDHETLFADVMLPLHVPDCFTYRVPFEYNEAILPGQRVVVQLGKSKLYSGVVRRLHTQPPSYATKYILAILQVEPIVQERQFLFWEWMASYYLCYPGDVMAVALPSAFRLSSESYLIPHPDFDGDITNLSENEYKILQALQDTGSLPVSKVSAITGFAKVMPLLHTMIENRIIMLQEELQERYTPRAIAVVALAPQYQDEEALRALFATLEKSKRTHKQLEVLMKYLQLSRFGQERVAKKQLTDCKELSPGALATLLKNGILVQESHTISHLIDKEATASPHDIILNTEQQAAYEQLRRSLPDSSCSDEAVGDKPRTVSLLHGVTGSVKTEVYIKLIADTVAQGRQVLFLLPEIALTAQIINRLRRYFGRQVGVYHSRFTLHQRAEVWHKTMSSGDDRYDILLGARSAIFLPYRNLGLVIVDEEHDSSYKQNEPAPRYHGRDSAIYLAQLYGAATVLGSATPGIESMFNARQGKYNLATIAHRYGGVQMPLVECVDMKAATLNKEVRLHISDTLMDAVTAALEHKEQVILFQNRRGFALHLECNQCHWIPTCDHCDVSLVYHKKQNSLRCHYCNHHIPVPTECPVCHSHSLEMKGFGTEHIEEDLGILFPQAHIARLDLDSTGVKNKYGETIAAFEEHKIDILVGTQMVTKGLDFDRVSVVGILSADSMLSYPDFRSYERAYQLMTQVAGRAGRHGQRGRVIIQSFRPSHPVIVDAIRGDYEHMFVSQINDRRVFRYPPFYRLIQITLKHRNSDTVVAAAHWLAKSLRTTLESRVMGPEYPIVTRIRNLYLMQIIIRFERSESLAQGKAIILHSTDALHQQPDYKSVILSFDVDPQ